MESQSCASRNFEGDLGVAQIAFAAILPLVLVFCVAVLVLYYRRRHSHPLAERPFRTNFLLLTLATVYLVELNMIYVARRGHACLWFLVFGWPLLSIIINCYMSRVWLTWFKFKATQEKTELRPLSAFARTLTSLRKAKSRITSRASYSSRPPSPRSQSRAHSVSRSGGGTFKSLSRALRSHSSSFTRSPRVSATLARGLASSPRVSATLAARSSASSRSALGGNFSQSSVFDQPQPPAIELSRTQRSRASTLSKSKRLSSKCPPSSSRPIHVAAPPSPRSHSRTMTHSSTLALVSPDYGEELSRSRSQQMSSMPLAMASSNRSPLDSSTSPADLSVISARGSGSTELDNVAHRTPGRTYTAPIAVSPRSSRSLSPGMRTPTRVSPSHSRNVSGQFYGSTTMPVATRGFHPPRDFSDHYSQVFEGSSSKSILKRGLTVPSSQKTRSKRSYTHTHVGTLGSAHLATRGSAHIVRAHVLSDSPRARSTSPVRPHKRTQSYTFSPSGRAQTPTRTLFTNTSFPRGSDASDFALPPAPPLRSFRAVPSPSHARLSSDPGFDLRNVSLSRHSASTRLDHTATCGRLGDVDTDTRLSDSHHSRVLTRAPTGEEWKRGSDHVDVVSPLPRVHTGDTTRTLSRASGGIAASLASHSATFSRATAANASASSTLTLAPQHDEAELKESSSSLRSPGHRSDRDASRLSMHEVAIHVEPSASSRTQPPRAQSPSSLLEPSLTNAEGCSSNALKLDTHLDTNLSRHLSSTAMSDREESTATALRYAQPVQWYLAHKAWATDKFVFRVFGAKGAVEWLLMMSPMFTSGATALWEEKLDDECFCPSLAFGFILFQVIVGYNALVMLIAAARYARLSDGFFIKREFKYVGIACVVGIAAWNGLGYLEFSFTEFPLQALWMQLLVLTVFSITGLYPLLKVNGRATSHKRPKRASRSWASRSWRREQDNSQDITIRLMTLSGLRVNGRAKSHKRPKRTSRSWRREQDNSQDITISVSAKSRSSSAWSRAMDLATFLRTEGGAEEFYEHLKLEFSVENLLFWQAVEAFRENFDSSDCNANRLLARELEQTFIGSNSDLQVNLNARECSQIRLQIERGEVNATLFDRAQRHAYRLMATDSFLRFRTARISAGLG